MDPLEQQIRDAFAKIPFADSGQNVLDADIVYSLEISESRADATVIIGKEHESFIGGICQGIEEALKSCDGIEEVGINVVNTLGEAQAANQPEATHAGAPKRTSYLGEYGEVILVASGKGGVGKSTTAVNLALALKNLGKKVSLLDADIYGPSVPVMMGSRGEFSEVMGQQLMPVSRYGIEYMSLGNLVEEEEAVVWRGPMAHQVLEQMLRDTTWPGGDYMIIDLPPGTGDVQITLAQMTEATGAVIVCTPQDVALLDARKAVRMFEKVSIPILGIVENMSSFICPHCGEETPIFSKGGAEDESTNTKVPFLGAVPIELAVREGGDAGFPVVVSHPESASAKAFAQIAERLIAELAEED
ncbi:MAG: Mrp/NBP35 family ATP-binding protein [bacterium]|nr:Mrp/NBP35 family ATP-binding protein [bacterium]